MPAIADAVAVATSKIFRSKAHNAIEAVTAKLDAARTELTDAESRRDAAALEIAMSDDPWAGEVHFDSVRRAAKRVQILEQAFMDAQRQEDARIAERTREEWKSQLRAIRQQISRMTKAAARYQDATSAQVSAFDEMEDAAGKIRRLLPADARSDNMLRAIGYFPLREACQLELDRQGSSASGDLDGRNGAPGTSKRSLGFFPLKTTPLAVDLERRLLGVFDLLAAGAIERQSAPAAASTPAKPPRKPPTRPVETITAEEPAPRRSDIAPSQVDDPEPDPSVPVHSDPEALAAFNAEKDALRKPASPLPAETENLEISAETLRAEPEPETLDTANPAPLPVE
jgi:hypothetical protein